MWNFTSIYYEHCPLDDEELGYLDKGKETWSILQRIAKRGILID